MPSLEVGCRPSRLCCKSGDRTPLGSGQQRLSADACALTFRILLFVNLLALGLVYQALGMTEQAIETHLEGLEVGGIIVPRPVTPD